MICFFMRDGDAFLSEFCSKYDIHYLWFFGSFSIYFDPFLSFTEVSRNSLVVMKTVFPSTISYEDRQEGSPLHIY